MGFGTWNVSVPAL